ncbi:hypothetical protein HDU83_004164 [Entophlyctis luteolus]|nr:hypothetical protein HDU83_004164 [Entophlyctis luteolus]
MAPAPTPANVLVAAIALRVLLAAFGFVQDTVLRSPVKYTDIDYAVFSDAASLVRNGLSPYLRATYRYTPLLAHALALVNGKFLFCACDLLAAFFISKINICIANKQRHSPVRLNSQSTPRTKSRNRKHAVQDIQSSRNINITLEASLWALNPFVAVISTRGNAESIIAALVLATVWALLENRIVFAAIVFGLAVHLKLKFSELMATAQQDWNRKDSKSIMSFFSRARLTFGIISASVFIILGMIFYSMYGHEFLEHTYLYHITRQDHRHNFSAYFYYLYLASTSSDSKLSGLLAFAPQVAVSSFVAISAAKHGDIAFALFAQTFAFVMLNKVVTSQYFMWYMCFLPIVLQQSELVLGGES